MCRVACFRPDKLQDCRKYMGIYSEQHELKPLINKWWHGMMFYITNTANKVLLFVDETNIPVIATPRSIMKLF